MCGLLLVPIIVIKVEVVEPLVSLDWSSLSLRGSGLSIGEEIVFVRWDVIRWRIRIRYRIARAEVELVESCFLSRFGRCLFFTKHKAFGSCWLVLLRHLRAKLEVEILILIDWYLVAVCWSFTSSEVEIKSSISGRLGIDFWLAWSLDDILYLAAPLIVLVHTVFAL